MQMPGFFSIGYRCTLVWTLQAVGSDMGRTWGKIQGQQRHRHRQNGFDSKRAGRRQSSELSDSEILSKRQRRGETELVFV